jgi:hypothetical protein
MPGVKIESTFGSLYTWWKSKSEQNPEVDVKLLQISYYSYVYKYFILI